MTDTAPVEDITDGAQKAYASDAVVKALIGKDTALAAHQPAHDVAKLVERLRHPVAEHWLKDAADAANLIDRQRAEIERLGREKYDLTIELEAAKEIIRRLEARWQVAQADYRAVMQAIGCESIAEVPDKLQAAESERDEARAEVERLRDICKFDCTGYPEMEAEAIKISAEICRAGGADAVLVLEAAERLFKAGLKDLSAPAKGAGHAE